MSAEQKSGKRRAIFNKDEIFCMLNVWADENIQNKFKTMRHSIVWEQISTTLVLAGYKKRSGCEIKCKINNLKAEYKRLKAISINALKSWPYFRILHEILGHRDIYNPNISDDSMYSSKSTNNNESIDYKNTAGCSWMDEENSGKQNELSSPCSIPSTTELEMEQEIRTTPKTTTVPVISTTTPSSTTTAFRRRPPRRRISRETKLIQTLINVEKRYVERLVAIEEREKKIEERENRVANSMCRFFDTLTQFLTQSSIPTFPEGLPCFTPITPNKSSTFQSSLDSLDQSRSPIQHIDATNKINNKFVFVPTGKQNSGEILSKLEEL